MIKVWYYSITTLSTIGYGDMSPVNSLERVICMILLVVGVTVFSFIMGQFIEILLNYNSMWEVHDHK